MQIYPAYTIKRIEDELSWRIVREMMNCWKGKQFKRTHGFEIEEEKTASAKQMNDQQLLSKLSQMGFL